MQPLARVLVAAALAALAACAGSSRHAASRDCAKCHKESVKAQQARRFVHEPFRDAVGCDVCHKRHGVKGENLLVDSEPALCLQCHDGERFERGRRHSAIEMSGCSGCHEPHAGDVPKLLDASAETLCATCHTDVAKPHGGYAPPGKSCRICHDPHSAASEKLLH